MVGIIKSRIFYLLALAICAAGLLTGCASKQVYAPVVNGWQHARGHSNIYIVQPDDTVYSIAWAFGTDYRDIVRANRLTPPYKIHAGQRLQMVSKTTQPAQVPDQVTVYPLMQAAPFATRFNPEKTQTTQHKPLKHSREPQQRQPSMDHQLLRSSGVVGTLSTKAWVWPTQGKVIRGYSSTTGGNRGIDIGGRLGQPIHAAAAGDVVYCGTGLRGYGKLIIIKHSDDYLSAYAFNKYLLVKEGQFVKAGQPIADMGTDDHGQAILHFEIRKGGKPVNPMGFLQ